MPSTNNSKRQRTVALPKPPPPPPSHSRILAPFRSIGHITSILTPPTPFALLARGKTFQITTALSNTIQTYDVQKLNLLFVSTPTTPSVIRFLIAHKDVVYTAFDLGVWVFKRGRKVAELEAPAEGWAAKGAWRNLLLFGEWIVGVFENGLVIWKRVSREVYTEIAVEGVVAGVHPSTFLNKIVVARRGGMMEIWNVKTSKKVYTILSPLPSPIEPTKAKPEITTLVQTPLIAVLAIGYSTGEIHLHNILTDAPLFTLNSSSLTAVGASSRGKCVTSISFCTDPAVGVGKDPNGEGGGKILAVGDEDGNVTLWHLEKRKVVGVMRNIHEGSSGGGVVVEWLNGQNILVTSGGDNSVKEWIFDSPHTTLPRLLRSRSGHSQPITTLTFLNPETSHFLLSSSLDRSLWALSMRNDSQAFELSQGAPVKKATKAAKHAAHSLADTIAESKAGPITCLATSSGEDGAGSAGREWEGIITGHRDERAARSWSFQHKKIGRWVLETHDKGEVKAVAISACGTFGFVGSSAGGIDMYNLQSGIHRGRFPQPLTQAQSKQIKRGEGSGKLNKIGRGKHTRAVTGIATDSLNRIVISTGLDGKIKFWEFTTGILLHEIDWSSTTAIGKMKLHRPSDLLAASCDDLCIRVVDIETRKVVRELWGCGGRISDFCFSNDGRWIIAASMDSVVRIWDLPTGHLIDGIRTESIVTALAFSGTGEYLATAHVDSVGVNLWTNRTLFTHVPTRRLTEEDIVKITMPSVSGEGGIGVIESAFCEDLDGDDQEEGTGVYTTADQLSSKILTMSLVPKTRWQTLLNLDVIRQRNKPTLPPKAPEKAPFFLPSLIANTKDPAISSNSLLLLPPPSAEKSAEKLAEETAALAIEKSRVLKMDRSSGESTFTTLLKTKDYASFIENFKTLPPSTADLEIRSLDTLKPYTEMVSFVHALTARLKSRRDYELVQTWMCVFLKVHGEVIIEAREAEDDDGQDGGLNLVKALKDWKAEQVKEAGRLRELVGYCGGVVTFLRSGR